MRKKTKKLVSLALVLCLALALIPMAAFAAEADANGFQIENGKLVKYTGPGGSVTIPDGVTEIGSSAFRDCKTLTGVNFPEGLIVIGANAFSNCVSLSGVVMPPSVVSVGQAAFSGCTGLRTATLSNKLNAVPANMFDNCPGLGSIDIPNSVASIGENAFRYCKGLSSVKLSAGLNTIGDYAFRDCTGLGSITIPNGVSSIEEGAFYGCKGLTSVTFPSSVSSLGQNAFDNCSGLTSVTLLNPSISIGGRVFASNESLTDVYYVGTQEQWDSLAIGGNNWWLDDVVVHCNYVPPAPELGPGSEVHFKRVNIYEQGQFTDVPASQWYTDSVQQAYEFGLMNGTGDSSFGPDGSVTVAQAITIAARIHSIYTTEKDEFAQGNPWYQVYLDYALENGIINQAYYDSDVNQPATRAQFAEIFANSLPEEALSPINDIPDGKIPDVSMTESYAPGVYKLYRAGILSGSDATGTFSPNTFIPRREAAAIVARMAESSSRQSFVLN